MNTRTLVPGGNVIRHAAAQVPTQCLPLPDIGGPP
jgi:hypothetical protein